MDKITRINTVGSEGFKAVSEASDFSNGSGKRLDMFKMKDVYPMYLRNNSPVKGIILPSFDPTINPMDATFASSYTAYRNTTNHQFTGWCTTVKGYIFYGKTMSNFISPSIIGQPDPIIMLRQAVYRKRNAGDNKYMYLVQQGPRKDERPALPGTSTLTLLNVWAQNTNEKAKDAKEYKNRILVLKKTATENLFDVLNADTPRRGVPCDSDWEDYFLGDVTNPKKAMVWSIGSAQASTGFTTAVINFGERRMTQNGLVFDHETQVIPDEALLGRYDLQDIEHVLNIPTPEQIVELLIEHAEIPLDLLRDVCGEYMPKETVAINDYKQEEEEYEYEDPQESWSHNKVNTETYEANTPEFKNTSAKEVFGEDDIPMEDKVEPSKVEGNTSTGSSESRYEELMHKFYTDSTSLTSEELIELQKLMASMASVPQ